MSTEENKAIVRRFFEEVLTQKNVNLADKLFAPNYVNHGFGSGAPPMDRETTTQLVGVFYTAFPDMHVRIEEQIAEGDTVATRYTMTGTHRGGFQGIAPTGKQISVSGVALHRVENGKIVEDRPGLDMLSLLQQLGVVPPMGQAR